MKTFKAKMIWGVALLVLLAGAAKITTAIKAYEPYAEVNKEYVVAVINKGSVGDLHRGLILTETARAEATKSHRRTLTMFRDSICVIGLGGALMLLVNAFRTEHP